MHHEQNPLRFHISKNSLPGLSGFKGSNYWHGLILNPAWISNYTPRKVWDEFTYYFHDATVKDWEWIRNFISPILMDVIIYLYMLGLIHHIRKRDPRQRLKFLLPFMVVLGLVMGCSQDIHLHSTAPLTLSKIDWGQFTLWLKNMHNASFSTYPFHWTEVYLYVNWDLQWNFSAML